MHSNASSLCLLLVALIGACHAVFYTKSTEVDYPRIGRRSFYTTGRGNNYPRIGRRSGSGGGGSVVGEALSDSQSSSLFSGDALSTGGSSLQDKRGFYTKNNRFRSYPRVGRAQNGGEPDDRLPEVEASNDNFLEDGADVQPSDASTKDIRVPLALLFLAYDSDEDGQLSKSEFMSGMTHYRQRNPLC